VHVPQALAQGIEQARRRRCRGAAGRMGVRGDGRDREREREREQKRVGSAGNVCDDRQPLATLLAFARIDELPCPFGILSGRSTASAFPLVDTRGLVHFDPLARYCTFIQYSPRLPESITHRTHGAVCPLCAVGRTGKVDSGDVADITLDPTNSAATHEREQQLNAWSWVVAIASWISLAVPVLYAVRKSGGFARKFRYVCCSSSLHGRCHWPSSF
jgi:hypothetical protein